MIRRPSMKLFASHDWGTNGKTHARVKEVVTCLRERGHTVWFDEEHMKGNIVDAMCHGIDTCDVVLVFVTCNYMNKVASRDDSDNCRREFMYAQRRHGTSSMVTIRFDPDLPKSWFGPVGMLLGERLYADLSVDHTSKKAIDQMEHLFPRSTNKLKDCFVHAIAGEGKKKAVPRTPSFARTNKPPHPPDLTLHGKGTKIKERVHRLMVEAGMSERPGEHTHEQLQRLMASMGIDSAPGEPLHCKLERAEHELGLDP